MIYSFAFPLYASFMLFKDVTAFGTSSGMSMSVAVTSSGKSSKLYYSNEWLTRRRSRTVGFSLPENDFYNSDETSTLKYLPFHQDIPPLSAHVLVKATMRYVNNGQGSYIKESDLKEAIEKEYKVTNVVVVVDGETFTNEASVRTLSMAALYRLPAEITTQLLETTGNEVRGSFERGGWESVSFPNGLGLCLDRKYRKSVSPGSPLAWRMSRRDRQGAIEYAKTAVNEASVGEAPPKRKSRQELLESIQREWFVADNKKFSFWDTQPLLFFPERRRLWKRVQQSIIVRSLNCVRRAVQSSLRVVQRAARSVLRRLVSVVTNIL